MIPIKLSLHNFMCYRDNVPPLSFDGIHTACISGDNGNGKSTLIDAITWALWGKTRAKSDDDLIHLGQTEMGVEFDFAIGGQPYRIIRKHARPKKRGGQGRTLLELQIANEDGFRTITGNSCRGAPMPLPSNAPLNASRCWPISWGSLSTMNWPSGPKTGLKSRKW